MNEEISVELYRVTPVNTQRLRLGAERVKIIIAENDNPGGIFEFSPLMAESYIVKVSNYLH